MAGIQGNYFSNLNSQLAAKGPDKAAVESARQASGDAAQTAKTSKPKEKSEGVQLSDKAMKSLQSEHADHVQGHEQELAQHAGLQEFEGDNNEQQEIRKERNSESYQHDVAEGGEQQGVRVQSKSGAEQFLGADQHERLTYMDDIDRHDPLADIPDANLRAADNVFATQAQKGLKPLSHLKPVPESEAAADMETQITPVLAEPMGIREPGNDRTTQPMQIDLPPETETIAAERAAQQLASGVLDEQMIVGGDVSTNGAAQVGRPRLDPVQSRELRSRRDECQQFMDQSVNEYVTSCDKVFKDQGTGDEIKQYLADTESKFAQELGKNGQPVDREVVRYAAIGQAAQDRLDFVAKENPQLAELMTRHTRDGQLDIQGYTAEANQMGEQFARQGQKQNAFMCDEVACCARLVSASHVYLDCTQSLSDAGEGPVRLANGKLDLAAAAANPATQSTLEGLRGLSEDQAWRTRETTAEGLSKAYDGLQPEQQNQLRSRVEAHVVRLETRSDDDSRDAKVKGKPEIDRAMVWAEEMEDWSASVAPTASPEQKPALQNLRQQAESYRLLRNVMDEKGWG